MGDHVRQQQVSIIGEGQGVYSFVHIDDATGATAPALECPPGAYNIVDGNPMGRPARFAVRAGFVTKCERSASKCAAVCMPKWSGTKSVVSRSISEHA